MVSALREAGARAQADATALLIGRKLTSDQIERERHYNMQQMIAALQSSLPQVFATQQFRVEMARIMESICGPRLDRIEKATTSQEQREQLERAHQGLTGLGSLSMNVSGSP